MLLEVVLTGASSPKYHVNSSGPVSLVTATNVMSVSVANTVPFVWTETAVTRTRTRRGGWAEGRRPGSRSRLSGDTDLSAGGPPGVGAGRRRGPGLQRHGHLPGMCGGLAGDSA